MAIQLPKSSGNGWAGLRELANLWTRPGVIVALLKDFYPRCNSAEWGSAGSCFNYCSVSVLQSPSIPAYSGFGAPRFLGL
ncbi:hypothetical protein TNCV_1022791 [Trichonephila clavipes]|nr:hypothetical protein TNCV_1022791 [Trichonephila clavipes]